MIETGLLKPAPLEAKLDSTYKATELKAMLKERGLPVSGKKFDCITRLVLSHKTEMESAVAHITAYVCTEAGQVLAKSYIDREEERERSAKARSFQLLCAGKLRDAGLVVAEFECEQVFRRGIGVDWSEQPSAESIKKIKAIREARPSILKNVSDKDWEGLQQAAAMMDLWAERSGSEWLPEGFIGASNLDAETAIRMVMFAGGHCATLAQLRESEITKVEISGCGEESCPTCKKMNGRKYRVSQVPELPHPDCTHEMGCRCMILPVFD